MKKLTTAGRADTVSFPPGGIVLTIETRQDPKGSVFSSTLRRWVLRWKLPRARRRSLRKNEHSILGLNRFVCSCIVGLHFDVPLCRRRACNLSYHFRYFSL